MCFITLSPQLRGAIIVTMSSSPFVGLLETLTLPHTHTGTHTHARKNVCTRTHTQAYTHMHTRTHSHASTHTYSAYIHTRAHARPWVSPVGRGRRRRRRKTRPPGAALAGPVFIFSMVSLLPGCGPSPNELWVRTRLTPLLIKRDGERRSAVSQVPTTTQTWLAGALPPGPAPARLRLAPDQ